MKRRLVAVCIAALAILAAVMTATISAATADTPSSGSALAGPTPNSALPGPIQVDPTLKVVATLRGVGKQVYDCNSATGTYTTPAREPMAGLFTTRGLPAGIHGVGPFWADFDGSRVVGALPPAGSAASTTDATRNVPWLKIAAKDHAGTGGVLSNVKFIQRTDTVGGQPPAKCGPPTIAVDYTAWYVFWA
jgi:hypothetical protein